MPDVNSNGKNSIKRRNHECEEGYEIYKNLQAIQDYKMKTLQSQFNSGNFSTLIPSSVIIFTPSGIRRCRNPETCRTLTSMIQQDRGPFSRALAVCTHHMQVGGNVHPQRVHVLDIRRQKALSD